MRDIFSDLYNKVLSFFTTPQNIEECTKEKAISRLKVVLLQDRAGFSERALQMMKTDITKAVTKYMEIDEELFELQLDTQEDKIMLILSIPVIRPKTDEEIDEAIKAEEEKTQVKAEEIVHELEEIIEERAQALADELLEGKREVDAEVLADEDVESDEDAAEADEADEAHTDKEKKGVGNKSLKSKK
ncbi:cell division topological specificity factor [Candidatus Gastranaerophilus sp. (ex Termes propinquus)]|nr:cell division topological specificity factor [Candidatus Gastranaerophilus sp. (ex Termes propinquus)]